MLQLRSAMFIVTSRYVRALKVLLATLLWNVMPHNVSYLNIYSNFSNSFFVYKIAFDLFNYFLISFPVVYCFVYKIAFDRFD